MPQDFASGFVPRRVNDGPMLTAYTLDELRARIARERVVLPICSLGTPATELSQLAPLVLPPLYHEALDGDLKHAMLARIRQCFPFYHETDAAASFAGTFDVVELPPSTPPQAERPAVVAFSVDTAVEEHGPHLPLATDTIQSYGVLARLRDEVSEFTLAAPVDYGHLTWGLPFGLSVDLTPELTTRYVTGYAIAIQRWLSPAAMYVVDVHGSPVHRQAIVDGLEASTVERFKFRWLHEPLVEFAFERGDQHAGGVETALVELIHPELLDSTWWPHRLEQLGERQMTFDRAIELSGNLVAFADEVESQRLNGIIGRIENYHDVDGELMMARILDMAREDVVNLVSS